jgi:hypothetical protein
MVNKFTNINKTNNHFSSQIIEIEKKTWNVGNPGSRLGEPQTYFDIGEIDDHPCLNFIFITGFFALKPSSLSHLFSQ